MEVVDAHSHQAKSLSGIEVYFVSQSQDDPRQFFAGGWRHGRCLTPGEYMELGGLQLQCDRSSDSRFHSRGRPGLLRKTADHWLGFSEENTRFTSESGLRIDWGTTSHQRLMPLSSRKNLISTAPCMPLVGRMKAHARETIVSGHWHSIDPCRLEDLSGSPSALAIMDKSRIMAFYI